MATASQKIGDPQISNSTNQPNIDSKFSCKSEHSLIALGVIVLIGSLVANGCLYVHIGYSSFAIGGSGLAVGILFFLLAKYCCKRSVAIQRSSMEKTSTTFIPAYLTQNNILSPAEFKKKDINKTQAREKAKQTIQKENNCVDIEQEASRFFFKDSEQHVVKNIANLIDEKVHKYITKDAIMSDLISHVEEKGFQRLSSHILEHPQLDGWILKGGGKRAWRMVANNAGTSRPNDYDNIMRVFMAERMSKVVVENGLDIIIPEKRLFAISFDQPVSPAPLHKKYLVFSKKVDILDELETKQALRLLDEEHQRKVARDICLLIKKTGFMDAYLGNIRWCASLQKAAIIDTESQGLLIEKNDKSPQQRYSIKKSALIGLQELKDKVGKEFPIFSEEATKAMQDLSSLRIFKKYFSSIIR